MPEAMALLMLFAAFVMLINYGMPEALALLVLSAAFTILMNWSLLMTWSNENGQIFLKMASVAAREYIISS